MIRNKSFTSFDGSKIKYSKIGNGKKKVFLVHGMLSERLTWLPSIFPLLLTNKYTFILVDLRGHGFSENKSYPHEKRNPHIDCAEDLHLLSKIELEEGEKAIVTAVSMGNAVVWNMKDSFGDDWVEKYICIDHSIVNIVPGEPRSNIFTTNSEEYWKAAHRAIKKILEDKSENSSNRKLSELPEDVAKDILRDQEIIIVESVLKGSRFGFLVNIVPRDILNKSISIMTKLYWNVCNLFVLPYIAYTTRTDFSSAVSSITKPQIFFVGMKNKVFNSSWQLECIENYASGSKVYKFEHSGHELMQAEPIKFIKCFKEALDS